MRPAPSRGEAIALMGERRYHQHYTGPQATYERDQVGQLLVALWNGGTVDSRWHDRELDGSDLSLDGYIEHLKQASKIGKNKADAGSRKAYVDPAQQNNWPAYRIDLERGLARLDPRTVACLELHHGWGWDLKRVGEHFGVTGQRIGQLVDAGVSLLNAHMNGEG